MRPGAFRYVSATSIDEVLENLSDFGDEATLLAGGQSLIPLMNLRLARPEVLIDLNQVPGLAGIDLVGGELRIGAMTRAADVVTHSTVTGSLPALSRAAAFIGHPQIRNRTTIGGNISHADPSSELPGVLAALDGSVTLRSIRGERSVGWNDFILSTFTNSRTADEMVVDVRFLLRAGWTFAYDEVAPRPGDYPLAGICAGVQIIDGVVREMRIVAVGVSDRPVVLSEVAQVSLGRELDETLIKELSKIGREELHANGDAHASSEYRKWLVGTLIKRILGSLALEPR
jgi:aerobic carbon-monoxide dehydrogenase medium subunit